VLLYGGTWWLREHYVEPGDAALACSVTTPPSWCVIRSALLFAQHNLLFGGTALIASSAALLRGGRGLALLGGALSLLALADYNVGTGALALVLTLIACVAAPPERALGQDRG